MVIKENVILNQGEEEECEKCQASCPVVKHSRNVTGTKFKKQFCLGPESFVLWQKLLPTPPIQGTISIK
jgi:hypothetical protein